MCFAESLIPPISESHVTEPCKGERGPGLAPKEKSVSRGMMTGSQQRVLPPRRLVASR